MHALPAPPKPSRAAVPRLHRAAVAAWSLSSLSSSSYVNRITVVGNVYTHYTTPIRLLGTTQQSPGLLHAALQAVLGAAISSLEIGGPWSLQDTKRLAGYQLYYSFNVLLSDI